VYKQTCAYANAYTPTHWHTYTHTHTQMMVKRKKAHLPAEKMKDLELCAHTFPIDLGLSFLASTVAPEADAVGNPLAAAAVNQQQQQQDMNCEFVGGQRFYNFDQLVQVDQAREGVSCCDKFSPDAHKMSCWIVMLLWLCSTVRGEQQLLEQALITTFTQDQT